MFIPTRRNLNPSSNFSDLRFSWRSLIMASLLILSSSADGLGGTGDWERNRNLEWEVLTRSNFSSQIHLQEHVLLLVTVQWSGEARALMREVAQSAASKPETFGALRLMVVYKNTEKMLADVLGATEMITIFCYQNSISYKYQGRLRAQNVLSSVNYLMSLPPEKLPLELLSTPEELETFLESTDKAVLLLEFCGWTRILLNKGKNNESGHTCGHDLSESGLFFGAISNGETNQTLASFEKDLRNGMLTSGLENGLSGTPLPGDLVTSNHTAPSEVENARPSVGVSCTFEDFQRFESFFTMFKTVAREFFLPPERQRFGLVSERSLLSLLGVEDPDSWRVMINFAGCPNSSKILKEGDDLKNALHMQHALVPELKGEVHDTNPALPAKEPSIILFVDRSSESLETRQRSRAALDTFRKLSLLNNASRVELSTQTFQGSVSRSMSDPSGGPAMDSSPSGRVREPKKKVSLMFVNKDGYSDIAADAQGKSLQDILAYLVQHKKEAKFSLLAKDVGFQLLSGDFEVKLANLLAPETETRSDKLSEPPMESIAESSVKLNKDVESSKKSESPIEAILEASVNANSDSFVNDASITQVDSLEQPGFSDSETYTYDSIERVPVKNPQFTPVQEPKHLVMTDDSDITDDMMVEESSPDLEEKQVNQREFSGFYFFADGDHLLRRSLTSTSKIPSMVIVDPVSQQHYVFPEEADFSYSSLVDFLDGFLNRSLISYQRSESAPVNSREATRPPFINLDFHEADSLPRVTANKFSELVLGFNQSDKENVGYTRKKDVLVLFSNTWCGFCQRMELVVREVFRAFKGYTNKLKTGTINVGPNDMIVWICFNPYRRNYNNLIQQRFSSIITSHDDISKLDRTFVFDIFRVEVKVENTFEECYADVVMLIVCGLVNDVADNLEEAALQERPLIFLMDCTLNDCSHLLNSMDQKELYPTLMLFPAQKSAISYQGDISVINIIKFIADHGSNFRHLKSNKGGQNGVMYQVASEDAPRTFVEDDLAAESKNHEVLLRDRQPTGAVELQVMGSHSDEFHAGFLNVVVGSILVSTDKLHDAPTFGNSKVLIIHADESTGFQGLIINKHISWNSLQVLDKDLEYIKQAPLSYGGPLMLQGMPLVSLTQGVNKDGWEVYRGIYFLDQYSTVRAIEGFTEATTSTDAYWFFFGYSSWGWNQLYSEIARGDWHVINDPEGVFDWPENLTRSKREVDT